MNATVHELALMTEVLARVCETARANNAAKVTAIHLVCGAVSGVVPDCLHFCFDVCAADTLAAGATLTIETAPTRWQCRACGQMLDSTADAGHAACPHCHARDIALAGGREVFLKSIEVE